MPTQQSAGANYRWDLSGPVPRLVLANGASAGQGILPTATADPVSAAPRGSIAPSEQPSAPSMTEDPSEGHVAPPGVPGRAYSTAAPGTAGQFGLGSRQNRALNQVIDGVTGLPFGIASTLINPTVRDTSWGTPFNTGGGGIIGAAGELSRRNLENVYAQSNRGLDHTGVAVPGTEQHSIALQDGQYHYGGRAYDTFAEAEAAQAEVEANTHFFAPGSVPGLNTPVAVHEGLIPGTTVVSGSLDHAGIPQSVQDAGPNAVRSYLDTLTSVSNAGTAGAAVGGMDAAARSGGNAEAERIAREAREDAARQEAAARAAAEARNRQEREAAQAAAAEAQRRANQQRANEELQRQRESGQSNAPANARAVTDSRGNPVRSSSGSIVTSGGSSNSGGGDSDGGGGGGGGTWCCTAAMKHGMPIKKVKALRKWHRTKSKLWQDGYDRWGYFIAEKLVKGSPFWASVTEAGYDLFVNKKVTWKGALAWLVIAPGSYVAGVIDAIQK